MHNISLKKTVLLCAAVASATPVVQPLHAQSSAQDSAHARELVVLVHGMGRSPLSMWPLARVLKREGYQVMNWGYSSTCCTVAEIGQQLADDLAERDGEFDRVHFVGHSLGTVIIRWVLAQNSNEERVGRVVMLAPPNQGARRADAAARHWGWLLKPLPELRTVASSTARLLGIPEGSSIGIIAGQYDGKVAVAETHLDGESAHVIVPARHSFLMMRKDVQRLTLEFLRNGNFSPAP